MEATEVTEKFKAYAFLELMGHRKLGGLVQEVEIANSKFLRIDVPDKNGKETTQFYSPGAVYCITPTTQEMVKAYASNNSPEPVHQFELIMPKADELTKKFVDARDDYTDCGGETD